MSPYQILRAHWFRSIGNFGIKCPGFGSQPWPTLTYLVNTYQRTLVRLYRRVRYSESSAVPFELTTVTT